jgi:hypothetical protein
MKVLMPTFMLAGQSNMAGRGGVETLQNGSKRFNDSLLYASVDIQAHEDIIMRYSADGHWEIAREPLHRDVDTGCEAKPKGDCILQCRRPSAIMV